MELIGHNLSSNNPEQENKLSKPESIEVRDGIKSKLEDEMFQYTFEDEIKGMVETLTQEFLNNRQQESKGIASFDKDFQKKYVDFRMQIATLLEMFKEFVRIPNPDNISELVGRSSEVLSPDVGQKIDLMLREYLKRTQVTENYYEKNENGDIFESVAGKKAKGEFSLSVHGNALVINAYNLDDFAELDKSSKDKVSLVAGFYEHDGVKVPGNENYSIPIIAINAGMKENMVDKLTEIYEEEWFEGLEGEWEELTGKNLHDDEDGEINEENYDEFHKWKENIPKEYSFETFLINKLKGDFFYDLFNNKGIRDEYELEQDVNNWESSRETTDEHEKQHHGYRHLLLQCEKKEYSLTTPLEVSEYFSDILDAYTRRLGDEIIATLHSDDSEYRSQIVGSDYFIREIREKLENKEKVTSQEKKEYKELTSEPKVHLTDKLYFYPHEHKKNMAKNLTEKIGKSKFKEWNIDGMWRDLVVEPFRKKKQQFELIGSFFLAKCVDLNQKDAKKVIGLLEIEPVESWPRLYYWIRNNPEILKDIFKK